MSLSSYQAPSAAAAAWTPPVGMQQPQMPQGVGGAGAGMRAPPSLGSGASTSNDNRGDRTGDRCISIDLFSSLQATFSAYWLEDSCECKFVSESGAHLVHSTEEGNLLLKKHGIESKDTLSSDQIVVGAVSSDFKTHTSVSPVAEFLSLRQNLVSGAEQIPVLPSNGATVSTVMSLLMGHIVDAAKKESGVGAIKNSGKKEKKKSKAQGGSSQVVTLVSPAGITQTQVAVLLCAAQQAGLSVQNVVNRGVAAVAGQLYRAQEAQEAAGAPRSLADCLNEKSPSTSPLVLYLNVFAPHTDSSSSMNASSRSSSSSGSNAKGEAKEEDKGARTGTGTGGQRRRLFFDAALVRCEGGEAARQQGNRLGYGRLCTLAAHGGEIDCDAAASSSSASPVARGAEAEVEVEANWDKLFLRQYVPQILAELFAIAKVCDCVVY
jgi:hypothetical protein